MLAACFSNMASACVVPTMTTDHLRELVHARGGWPVSDAKCMFLAAHHLQLVVTAEGIVLNGVNVGWATATLANADLVTSSTTGIGTSVSRGVASQNTADDEAYGAIGQAISTLDWVAAAREVDKNVHTSGARITARDWKVL